MTQVLNQDEVDALLSAISVGQVETETPVKPQWMAVPSGVNRYDFARQHQQIFRGQMPTLRAIYNRFASMAKTTLSALIGKNVYINLSSIKMENFGEFVGQLPRPSSFHLFQADLLRSSALLALEGPLAYALLEASLGGGGLTVRSLKTEGRDLTIIEQKLITRIVLEMLPDLEKAWQPILPIKTSYIRTETNPQFIEIISSSSLVVTASFDLRIEQPLGLLHLSLPQATLEPIKSKLQQEVQEGGLLAEDKEQRNKLTEGLREVSTNVVAELGRTEISTFDLLNLKRGDVITLDNSVHQEVLVKIEGVPKFRGHLGTSQGNLAIQINSKITKDKRRWEES